MPFFSKKKYFFNYKNSKIIAVFLKKYFFLNFEINKIFVS